MKKYIWIMNHYAGSMFFDKGGRHYNFAKYLRKAGYEPVIFCANSKHGQQELFFDNKDLWHEHIAEEIATPFVFVQARAYQGNGKQRVLNMIDFYRNVKKTAREYVKTHKRPDIIYASSVHPLTLVAGIQLAKHFGVKCICEVRDLWPESIVAYSSHFTRQHPLMRILYRGERWIYTHADALIFTMEGAYDYIIEQGWEKEIPRGKVHYINNGVDLEMFDYNKGHFPVIDPDLSETDLFTVVYAGSIRQVNHVGLLLDVAKELRGSTIRFLIWGDGDELSMLQKRVEEESISNIVFKGRVAKKYIPSITSQAKLNLVHWEQSDLLRYGVSYNKLFEYLAAGRPIFSTVRPGYSILARYCCGMDTEGFTLKDFCAGIQHLATLPVEEFEQMGANARSASADYDFFTLTQQLIQIIEEC